MSRLKGKAKAPTPIAPQDEEDDEVVKATTSEVATLTTPAAEKTANLTEERQNKLGMCRFRCFVWFYVFCAGPGCSRCVLFGFVWFWVGLCRFCCFVWFHIFCAGLGCSRCVLFGFGVSTRKGSV